MQNVLLHMTERVQLEKIILLPPKYEIVMVPSNHSNFQYCDSYRKVGRAITKYGAIEKSPMLLSQYWKIDNFLRVPDFLNILMVAIIFSPTLPLSSHRKLSDNLYFGIRTRKNKDKKLSIRT